MTIKILSSQNDYLKEVYFMEQEKQHHCYNCRHYDAVYLKKICTFERQNAGFCSESESVVKKHDGCNKWKYDTPVCRYGRRFLRKDIVYKRIIETLEGLKVLEQIVREEYEENKTEPLPPR